jgi:hypothetical protein
MAISRYDRFVEKGVGYGSTWQRARAKKTGRDCGSDDHDGGSGSRAFVAMGGSVHRTLASTIAVALAAALAG